MSSVLTTDPIKRLPPILQQNLDRNLCTCNEVVKMEIIDAILSGATTVEAMFVGIAKILKSGAPFLLYGPFMVDGQHTSESNWRFDRWIRSWEAHRGIRDVTWLKQIAQPLGLVLEEDIAMPENNRTLVWIRSSAEAEEPL